MGRPGYEASVGDQELPLPIEVQGTGHSDGYSNVVVFCGPIQTKICMLQKPGLQESITTLAHRHPTPPPRQVANLQLNLKV